MGNSGIMRAGDAPPSGMISGISLKQDADGGIDLEDVRPGLMLEIQTRNHTYTLIPQANGDPLVWGHPELCPEPTSVKGVGSAYVSGFFREGYLGPGMRFGFKLGERRVSTSRIVSIKARAKS